MTKVQQDNSNSNSSSSSSNSNGGSINIDRRDEEAKRVELQSYIPDYLKQFINPYHDEFCYTRIYHYRLVAALMVEGFLPIAIEGVILPKLHHKRCVIPLPESLHVSKSIRKKSKKYRLSINQCFDRVVEGCRRQHGPKCWLYPELVRVFKEIHDADHVNSIINPSSTTQQQQAPVRLYSIEVFNEETGDLAAGELGYTVGSIYTSLTGFSAENSAGSVQLASLGRLLSTLHFSMWDLGMDMNYKRDLGSCVMPRNEFVAHVHDVRVTKGYNILPTGNSNIMGFNCKSLIDRELPLFSISNIDGETEVSFMDAIHTQTIISEKYNRGGKNSNRPTNYPQPNRKKQRNTSKQS